MGGLLALLFSGTVQASVWLAPPHMDLQMTGAEYYRLLQNQASVLDLQPRTSDQQILEQYLVYGQRALQWVVLINQGRTPETRISLSSFATSGGNSPNNPSSMSMRSIQERWDLLRQVLPSPYNDVVFAGAAMPATVPASDREFIEWIRQVDIAYQLASRMKLLWPYKEYLIRAARQDVRGYLALRADPESDRKLSQWPSRPAAERRRWIVALVRLCMNSDRSDEACSAELDTAIAQGKVLEFKNRYIVGAQRVYDGFFNLAARHPDVEWKSDQLLEFPFLNPGVPEILDFLKVNIEDEWRYGDWRLRLRFVDRGPFGITHVRFEPGAVPHVNGLGGNEIVMDRNAPLSEYEVQWTIRHEYGHILGFPDCYIEFYDVDADAIVSYQLDLTNLMCSRRGHILESHFSELKRVYGTSSRLN